MSAPGHSRTGQRALLLAVAFASAYFALSRASLALVDDATAVAVIWPASGLALAVFILAPRERWPALAAAVLAGNLAAQLLARSAVAPSVALAGVNALEPVLAAALFCGIAGGPRAGSALSTRAVGALVAAATAANALTTTLGAITVTACLGAPFAQAWATWFLADGLGMLLVAPLVLTLPRWRVHAPWSAAPIVLVFAQVAITIVVFFHAPGEGGPLMQYGFGVVPLLLALAIVGPPPATGAGIVLTGVLSSAATARGLGPFATAGNDELDHVQVLQAFLAVGVLSVLLVAAVVSARAEAHEQAQAYARRLASVLHAATESSIIGTGVDGTIEVFNRGAERMLGYHADELVGRHTPERLHDRGEIGARAAELGVAPGFHVLVAQARDGEAETRDWTYVRADGGRLTVSLTVTAMRDEHGAVTGFIGIAEDVTEKRRAEADLRTMFEASPTGQAVVDACGVILDVNPALAALTGHPRESLVGARVRDLLVADVEDDLAPLFRGERATAEFEREARRASGEPIVLAAQAVLLGAGGRHPRALVQLTDVTERRRAEEQLQHRADHDALTGLLNRRRFEEELGRHVALLRREGDGGCSAAIVLDIDDFKSVNDTHGHHVGDEVIARVGTVLQRHLRGTDLLARLGGDEFAILLPATGRDDAVAVARKLVDGVRREAGGVTISLGVAVLDPATEPTAERVLIDADLAMYEAKHAGRDGFAVFGEAVRSA